MPRVLSHLLSSDCLLGQKVLKVIFARYTSEKRTEVFPHSPHSIPILRDWAIVANCSTLSWGKLIPDTEVKDFKEVNKSLGVIKTHAQNPS